MSRESDPTSALPQVTSDLYQIDGEFARGGLGRILSARDRHLGREVALKESLSQDPKVNQRFVREALITARLQHPGIVPVYQAGTWPDGAPFYTMRRVAGHPLADEIQRLSSPSAVEARLALLPRVLVAVEAIAYAHHQGVIHRDLKPENILLGQFGETVVIDWGIARDLRGETGADPVAEAIPALPAAAGTPPASPAPGTPSASPIPGAPATPGAGATGPRTSGLRQTEFGAILGTPEFMPPEQAAGLDVDERADVYALGAILYELLAGQAAYTGPNTMSVLAQVLGAPPTPLPERQPGLPRDLCAIVAKAMGREPKDRYRDAGALAEDLHRFLNGRLVAAHRYSPLERVRRYAARHRGVVAVGAAGLLLLLATAGISLHRIVAARRAAEAAYQEAARRASELLLQQARASLLRDPAESLAWLKQYPESGPGWADAHAIAVEAAGRGVARHVLRGHRGAVTHAAWSPDGRLVASGGADGSVRLCRIAAIAGAGPPAAPAGGAGAAGCRVLGVHGKDGAPEPVSAVAFAPDGRTLASAGGDGAVRLWDTGPGGGARVLSGHYGRVGGVRFSADGALLLSFGEDRTVRVWDLRHGGHRSLPGHTDEVLQAIFLPRLPGLPGLPEGGVASGGRDRSARVFNLRTGDGHPLPDPARLPPVGRRRHGARAGAEATPAPAGHTDHVTDLSVSRNGDGALLATAGRDRTVRVWDLATGAGTVLSGHSSLVTRVAFSPRGDLLASAGADGAVRLWRTGEEADRLLVKHDGAVVALDFSPDGRTLASAGADLVVRLSDVATSAQRALAGHESALTHVSFSPDGAWLLSASRDGSLRVFSAGALPGRALPGHTGPVNHLAFSPDGRHLASASADHTVRLFDLRDLRDLRAPGDPRPAAVRVLSGHTDSVYRIAFSPDGRTLASASFDDTARLWEVESDTARVLRGHATDLMGLAFSPDGRTLATASVDRTVRLWDLTQDAISASGRALSGPAGGVWTVAYARDGRRVAGAGLDRAVYLWDPEKKSVQVLRGHDGSIDLVLAAPDGRTIASAGADGTVRLWPLPGQPDPPPPLVLRGHADAVSAAAFAPDGALASGGQDGAVFLWDPGSASGRALDRFTGRVTAIAFSPDGELLAAGSRDGSARVWTRKGGDVRVVRLGGPVRALAYSVDGALLAVAGDFREVRLVTLRSIPVIPAEQGALRAWLEETTSARIGAGDRVATP